MAASLVLCLWLACAALATAQIALDRDRRADPVTFLPVAGPGDLVVTTVEAPRAGNFTIRGDLIVRAGGVAEFRDGVVRVEGEVVLERGAVLRLVGVDFGLVIPATLSTGRHYRWFGGHLETIRCQIGGDRQQNRTANFYLHDGVWVANDTTVHDSGGILIGESERTPAEQRGLLIADGLFGGQSADFVHLNGNAEAILRNSGMAIAVRLFDRGPGAASFDASDRRIPFAVFGDAAFHDGVTPGTDIPGSPWRLELENCRVPRWAIEIFDVRPGGSQRSITIRDGDAITVGIHATDLVGSPELVGPWTDFYATLPGLPSTTPNGHHVIPPGCGVRFGPLTVSAPADVTSGTRISFWSLYLDGPATNFVVRGTMQVAEAFVRGGQLLLEGDAGFDAGTYATKIRAFENGRIKVANAVLGSGAQNDAEAAATGYGVVEFERVRLRKLRLRTGRQQLAGPSFGIDAGTLTMRDWLPSNVAEEPLTVAVSPSRPSSLRIERALVDEDFDLSNIDFEAPLRGNTLPANWSAAGTIVGALSNDVPVWSTGQRSFEFSASGPAWSLRKRLRIVPSLLAELEAAVRVVGLGAGAFVELAISGNGGSESALRASASTWQRIAPPTFHGDPSDSLITVEIRGAGDATVRIDDLRLRFPAFWESDNLQNLDFEAPSLRQFGDRPNFHTAPDYWSVAGGRSQLDRVEVDPASAGQIAVRFKVLALSAALLKRLQFVAPGQTVTVNGTMRRDVPGARRPNFVKVFIGSGNNYFQGGAEWTLTQDGWQPFQLSWTVPPGTPFVTVALWGAGANSTFLADDVAITVTP